MEVTGENILVIQFGKIETNGRKREKWRWYKVSVKYYIIRNSG